MERRVQRVGLVASGSFGDNLAGGSVKGKLWEGN